MTTLGEPLSEQSITKAEIACKTGLSKMRLNKLITSPRVHLRVDELFFAMAIDANPCDFLEHTHVRAPETSDKVKRRIYFFAASFCRMQKNSSTVSL